MSEEMRFDVIIIGAGPAGISAAIRLKQLAASHQQEINICILEKGSEVGAHILSGNVLETKALDELLPDWRERGAPLHTKATSEEFYFLTKQSRWKLPTPPQMNNHDNYIISLSTFTRWLAGQAEQLGIEIYAGFAVEKCLMDDQDKVIGIQTVAMGLDKTGEPTAAYEPGMTMYADHIMVAEGCRGSVAQQLIKHYQLDANCDAQTYGLGIKEVWEVDPKFHRPGHIEHSIGWPLDQQTYGGTFIYHGENNQVFCGIVVGLDYQNPYLNPYLELQRFKHHPLYEPLFASGRRIAYGARALNEGGWQSIPKLTFPGGSLIGCAAGFLNVPKIKGTHTAMKSAMIAAECAYAQIKQDINTQGPDYNTLLRDSWVGTELWRARNIRPGFRKGLIPGLLNAALETYITKGKSPWTLKNHADHLSLKKADECVPIDYPKNDGKISFDRLSNVFYSSTNHAEHQPCHLVLKNPELAIRENWEKYKSPEIKYCPAGVYEIVQDAQGQPHLEIHSQNCVHCKTCDIKDPNQNILWKSPQGGGGPNYTIM